MTDFETHFRDMEIPLRQLEGALATLEELSAGGTCPIEKQVVGFVYDGLREPVAWIKRLFREAYLQEPPMAEGSNLGAIDDDKAKASKRAQVSDAISNHIGRLDGALVDLSNGLKDLGPAIQELVEIDPQTDISRLNFIEKGLRSILIKLDGVHEDLRLALRRRTEP